MKRVLQEELIYEILAVVEEIPEGVVMKNENHVDLKKYQWD